MKQIFSIYFCLICCISVSQSAKDFLNGSFNRVTWLGIDFSHAKFVGDFSQFNEFGKTTSESIKDNYFLGWNNVVSREYEKFNIAKMVRYESVMLHIDAINEINSKVDPSILNSSDCPDLLFNYLQDTISTYNFGIREGYGILFVAECFDKVNKIATYRVLILDLLNKKILINEKVSGNCGGIGLRNYWANTFYEVIEKVRKEHFKEWKKMY